MQDREIIKYLKGLSTKKEQQQVEDWIIASKKNTEYFNLIKATYTAETFNQTSENTDVNLAFSDFESAKKPIAQLSNRKNNYLIYAAAASIALIIAVYIFSKDDVENDDLHTVTYENNIKIGTDKAILTLEDGSRVALEKGQTYKAENVESTGEKIIYRKAKKSTQPKIAYNTLTIPRGGQFYVELSDDTKVWLNSESQLRYPVTFTAGATRKVELVYGEAYFEVSPSTAHQGAKFKVLSQEHEVEVLGTQFNLKAYKDEVNIYTTLVEGKVSILANGEKNLLFPNQQSSYNPNTTKVNITAIDVFNTISWKNGIFSFERKSLYDIMKVLARWYDFNVTYQNPKIKSIEFTGILDRDQSIEDILSTIKDLGYINSFGIQDKRIVLE